MEAKELSKLIDDRNYELWHELNKKYDIKIKIEFRTDYKIYLQGNKSTIYVQKTNLDSASFTHELLHLWLQENEVTIGGGLVSAFKSNKVLSYALGAKLGEHIANCLDHSKMLPEFVKLGYSASNFTLDYNKAPLTDKVLRRIFKNWPDYKADVIQEYIGVYFAAFFTPNKSFNFLSQFDELRNLDYELFDILNTFSVSWLNFDISLCKKSGIGYQMILFNFLSNIESWIQKRTVTKRRWYFQLN